MIAPASRTAPTAAGQPYLLQPSSQRSKSNRNVAVVPLTCADVVAGSETSRSTQRAGRLRPWKTVRLHRRSWSAFPII